MESAVVDWGFELPVDTSFADPKAAEGDDALEAVGDVALEVAGIPVAQIIGTQKMGYVDPVGNPVDLDGIGDDVVGPADQRLSLEELNRSYNPFASQPQNAIGQPLVGPFSHPTQVYEGKTFVPVRQLMQALAAAAGNQAVAVQPLVNALSTLAAFRVPVHQFNLPGGPGNRVLFYGGSVAHRHIDEVVNAMGDQSMRVIKQMVHFNEAASAEGSQGGTPDEIVKDGVGGSTHSGGYSSGFDAGGKSTVKSDWPHSYGMLDDAHEHYNANLFAVDYQAGTQDDIPQEMLTNYKNNADMWDVCAGLVVPFASQDRTYRDYTYNPLEVHDQESTREVAAALVKMDRANFLDDFGAFYCAEGQFSVANLGPQEDEQGGTLLKKSRYGGTAFGNLIDNFQKAPAYQGMTPDERRQNPNIGWQHLVDLGSSGGGIDRSDYNELKMTGRTSICLNWIPEDCVGWQAYRPTNPDGMIARPMSVVTMAWGLLRRYIPREYIARTIAGDILRAYEAGDEDVKAATRLLCAGNEPTSPIGSAALASIAVRGATGMLLGILSADAFRDRLLYQAGFKEITNDADKQRVLNEYQKFVDVMRNADHSSQEKLDSAVRDADESFSALQVERKPGGPNSENSVAKKYLMKYAAPACMGMWAQQPYLAETGCLRYIATAMHKRQGKG